MDRSAVPPPALEGLQLLRERDLGPVEALNSLFEGTRTSADLTGPAEGTVPPEVVVELHRVMTAVAEERPQEALDLLEDSSVLHALGTLVVDVIADPFMDPIRDDPRYRSFLREVGLAEYWPTG